jgi:RNase P/RNase MRP subunit POP5
VTKKELTEIVQEALSAWDLAQKKRKEAAKNPKTKGYLAIKGASSMKITKEHLTRIVREAVEEVGGEESWWDKKKKELDEEKAVKKESQVRGKGIAPPGPAETAAEKKLAKKEALTKEALLSVIREEIEKLMNEEPQVSATHSGVPGAEEDYGRPQHSQEDLLEADSEEDELRSGSNTRETEDRSETPPRTLKEGKKSVLLARPKR